MPSFPLSPFGERLSAPAGIVSLMDDLGEALNVNPDILFLGGGNPARIPEVEQAFAQALQGISANPEQLHKMLGVYQSPRGHEGFIERLVPFLNERCGWSITSKNIALANGSQSAFFILLNMLAVPATANTPAQKIHLPMAPEYLGYSGQTVAPDMFCAHKPLIELVEGNQFRYRVDLATLANTQNVAAYCVSMPTNPTGNVLARSEVEALQALAAKQQVPLILDCAYGAPLPGIVYQEVALPWSDNSVYMFSLSKLGLPGARTGIIVGPEELVEQFVNANTVASLANGNTGPALAEALMAQGQLETLIQHTVTPFYLAKRNHMLGALEQALAGLPCRVHCADGAFFVWLWLQDLPISAHALYLQMKAEGVLIMPGEPFFFGLDAPWDHAEQCIRLSYCQSDEVIVKAVTILGRVLRKAYGA